MSYLYVRTDFIIALLFIESVQTNLDCALMLHQNRIHLFESKDIITVRFNVSRRAICRVLANCLCIGGYSPHEEIGTRLRCLSMIRVLWSFLVA
ncbi:hypothetical protein BDC45DRAFT_527830 [Circinella umbellata]|nr:hypothetical protein BDC45DRAFT_527830 [Circinella umbellata]